MKKPDTELSKGFKIISYITLSFTSFYFLAHLLLMVSESDLTIASGEFEYSLFLMMLLLDIVSLFIYIPLLIISLIYQSLYMIGVIANKDTSKGTFYIPTILSIVFGGFSIYGISQLFLNAC